MNPEILGRLLDEQGAALVLFARQWCDSPEDVVQESLIKLSGVSPSPKNAVAWLYRTVRNGAISASRSARRRQQRERSAAEQSSSWFLPSPKTEVQSEEATDALQGLPLEQREVIVAHLWGGRTFEEIGVLNGTSSSTAHRFYLTGLAALRERLGLPCPKKPTTPS